MGLSIVIYKFDKTSNVVVLILCGLSIIEYLLIIMECVMFKEKEMKNSLYLTLILGFAVIYLSNIIFSVI